MSTASIALENLYVQLHAVEAGWWHDCPSDVRDSLLRHRKVIDCLWKGVNTKRWSADALPYTSIALAEAPELLAMSPDEAAAVAAAARQTSLVASARAASLVASARPVKKRKLRL